MDTLSVVPPIIVYYTGLSFVFYIILLIALSFSLLTIASFIKITIKKE